MVNPDAKLRLTREEVFGPVVNLVRVADGEEALQLANDTEYGLTASVWTQNLSRLWNIAIAYRQGRCG
ncbi:aldehyde dehydrogenase family protein [Escherichia coli]|nr:aldehyde dehydrogenase family protein [Escherichia coli]